jgi:choline dehydrogenase-like flavoprotein
MQWSDNEEALFRDSLEQGAAMLEAAGAVDIKKSNKPKTPGDGIHEVGTARMGHDPKRSVLNQYCQSHDIKNLFVTDGAAFPSLGSVNPTLTMMANTVRACDYLVAAARRRELG